MDKKTYFDKCKFHDWFFQMSDDSRAYNEGRRERDELLRIAEQFPDLKPIYQAWSDYMFGGNTSAVKPTYEMFGL
jgi:hypothetical protein